MESFFLFLFFFETHGQFPLLGGKVQGTKGASPRWRHFFDPWKVSPSHLDAMVCSINFTPEIITLYLKEKYLTK